LLSGSASYLAGGAALAIRRTAPLGLALLAPAVTIILLFDVVVARLPVPGLAWPGLVWPGLAWPGLDVELVWAVLALRHFDRFRCLWNVGQGHLGERLDHSNLAQN
jgi:hypothetical protein